MTWRSTADYYRLLNEGVRERLGGSHSARVLIASVDEADVEPLMREGRWDEAGALLAADAAALERAGADVFVLACNSMHRAWETIVAPLSIPSIHIGEAAADALPEGAGRVALLGTRYTMEGDFIRGPIAARGVEVVVPEAAERAEVHRVIFEELSDGVVRDESRAYIAGAIDRLGADAVVLGCGELALLELDLPASIDTVRAHARAAVDYALADA